MAVSSKKIGIPWSELNDGLSYHDVVRPSDAGVDIDLVLLNQVQKFSSQGWLQRLTSHQIMVDTIVDTDPNTLLRGANQELGKIAKIFRALASGIIDNDKVKYPGVAKGLYLASQSGKPALSVVDILETNVQENTTLVLEIH